VPKRIQRKRIKGWRMPENAVYVGRPTKFGNPFYAPPYSRAEAVRLYRRALLSGNPVGGKIIQELRGKDLACWCPLVDKNGNPVPCHADVLLEIAK